MLSIDDTKICDKERLFGIRLVSSRETRSIHNPIAKMKLGMAGKKRGQRWKNNFAVRLRMGVKRGGSYAQGWGRREDIIDQCVGRPREVIFVEMGVRIRRSRESKINRVYCGESFQT